MKQTLPSRLLVIFSVGALAVGIASSQDPPAGPAHFEPAVGVAPYESPYPPPQIDRNARPPEAAPTF